MLFDREPPLVLHIAASTPRSPATDVKYCACAGRLSGVGVMYLRCRWTHDEFDVSSVHAGSASRK